MSNGWKKINSKIVYKTPWMKVREDKVVRPDGKPGTYSYVETNGPSVMIVPIDNTGKIFLIKEQRYTAQKDSWEVPGGNSDGENLLKAAKRELIEEAGLVADSWKMVGDFQSNNGMSTETGYVFIAKKIKIAMSDKKSEEGIVDMNTFTLTQVLAMIKNSRITDGASIIAIFKAYLHLGI